MIDEDRYSRVRVVQTGGFAGTITRADVDRAELTADQAQAFDQACRELSSLGRPPDSERELGADIPQFRVEIGSKDGDARTFQVSASGGTGAAVSGDIEAVISKLNALSH